MKFFLNVALMSIFSIKALVNTAEAQVVILPQGFNQENDFVTFLVALIGLVLLLFAARHSYRNGQLDFALRWFTKAMQRIRRR